jgi:4a-hydroxytetrahydrobiopterin dehydratase
MAELTGNTRNDAISGLQDWGEVAGRDAIQKTFQFKIFKQAFGLMPRAALTDGSSIGVFNVSNRAEVTLATLDAGGTDLDNRLARFRDEAVQQA